MADSFRQLLLDSGSASSADRGAEVSLSFGDVAAEWAALDAGAGLVDLAFRRHLLVEGEERAEFLHGQLTADIKHLAAGAGCPAAVLNAQGRALALMHVWNRGDDLLIATNAAHTDTLVAALERFLVADDVEFLPEPARPVLGLVGPQAFELLEQAGLSVVGAGSPGAAATAPRYLAGAIDGSAVELFVRDDLRVAAIEVRCLSSDDACSVWKTLAALGAKPAGVSALEILRVESGCVRYGVDLDESRLAIEAGLYDAIHYAKGCYVGQEVVERAVSRGKLKRALCLVRFEGEPEAGACLSGGSEAEFLASVVVSPREGPIGLAYLPTQLSEAGSKVSFETKYGAVSGEVLAWPRPTSRLGRTRS
jgi:folate-binding protein YgfZ